VSQPFVNPIFNNQRRRSASLPSWLPISASHSRRTVRQLIPCSTLPPSCDEAGLPHCTAHGLRKAGASLAAENGATDRELMALYDWESAEEATTYTRQANRKKLAGQAARKLRRHM
jgi:integrase